MNFDQRMAICRAALFEMLESFAPPRGLGEAAQVATVSSITEALNRKIGIMPESEFRETLRKTFVGVRDHHKSYVWPSQAAFVEAVPVPVGVASGAAPKTYETNRAELYAKRMRAEDPVPEAAVWGDLSVRLAQSGDVPQSMMDSYRAQSVRHHNEVYRERAEELMLERLGEIVRPYLGESIVSGQRSGCS